MVNRNSSVFFCFIVFISTLLIWKQLPVLPVFIVRNIAVQYRSNIIKWCPYVITMSISFWRTRLCNVLSSIICSGRRLMGCDKRCMRVIVDTLIICLITILLLYCCKQEIPADAVKPARRKACQNCSNSTCFVSFHRISFPQIANA